MGFHKDFQHFPFLDAIYPSPPSPAGPAKDNKRTRYVWYPIRLRVSSPTQSLILKRRSLCIRTGPADACGCHNKNESPLDEKTTTFQAWAHQNARSAARCVIWMLLKTECPLLLSFSSHFFNFLLLFVLSAGSGGTTDPSKKTVVMI